MQLYGKFIKAAQPSYYARSADHSFRTVTVLLEYIEYHLALRVKVRSSSGPVTIPDVYVAAEVILVSMQLFHGKSDVHWWSGSLLVMFLVPLLLDGHITCSYRLMDRTGVCVRTCVRMIVIIHTNNKHLIISYI